VITAEHWVQLYVYVHQVISLVCWLETAFS